jgi:hypothetical protein
MIKNLLFKIRWFRNNFASMEALNRQARIIKHYELATELYHCHNCYRTISSKLSSREIAIKSLVKVKSGNYAIRCKHVWFKDCVICGERLSLEYSE